MRHDWPTLTRTYVENLVSIYTLATPAEIKAGKRWYPDANHYARELAKRHHVAVEIAAGVIAALSPGSEWTRNKVSADTFLLAHRSCGACALDQFKLTTYGAKPLLKAQAIVQGAPIEPTLHGAKTTAFYRSIMNPKQTRDVCIDGHAKSACIGTRVGNHSNGVKVERNEYPHLEAAFLTAASIAGLLPAEFQAVIWLVWKRQPVGYKVQSILEVAA